MIIAAVTLMQPAGLVGSYSGFPGCSNPLGIPMRVLSHSVTAQLGKSTDAVQTLTLIKNLGKLTGAITIQIPTHVRGAGTMGALQGLTFGASWDKVPVTLTAPSWGLDTNTNALISKDGFVTAQVTVKPNATHALRVNWTGDMMMAGADGKERVLAYDLTTLGGWQSSIGKFNYSIQTGSPNPIFSVIGKVPKAGWQVGTKGAFLSANNYSPTSGMTMYFTYYPNSY